MLKTLMRKTRTGWRYFCDKLKYLFGVSTKPQSPAEEHRRPAEDHRAEQAAILTGASLVIANEHAAKLALYKIGAAAKVIGHLSTFSVTTTVVTLGVAAFFLYAACALHGHTHHSISPLGLALGLVILAVVPH
jgi:hypothetical protein